MIPAVFRTQDGRLYLIRCPRCGKTNPVLCVPSGVCDSCGYVAEEEDVT